MSTTYVFDRGSRYGDAEFLGNLDLGCEGLTEEQVSLLREKYIEKVQALVESYDPTLIWWPSLSEIWGEVDNTKSDPFDFREWWTNGHENGRWEEAYLSAYEETMEEGK